MTEILDACGYKDVNECLVMEPDEDMAYNKVKGYLYESLARAYMQKYDATKKKENITGICNEIIAVYKEMLAEEDWMTDSSCKGVRNQKL